MGLKIDGVQPQDWTILFIIQTWLNNQEAVRIAF